MKSSMSKINQEWARKSKLAGWNELVGWLKKRRLRTKWLDNQIAENKYKEESNTKKKTKEEHFRMKEEVHLISEIEMNQGEFIDKKNAGSHESIQDKRREESEENFQEKKTYIRDTKESRSEAIKRARKSSGMENKHKNTRRDNSTKTLKKENTTKVMKKNKKSEFSNCRKKFRKRPEIN